MCACSFLAFYHPDSCLMVLKHVFLVLEIIGRLKNIVSLHQPLLRTLGCCFFIMTMDKALTHNHGAWNILMEPMFSAYGKDLLLRVLVIVLGVFHGTSALDCSIRD